MSSLEREYDFYKSHKNQLLKEYEGKYVAIKDQKIIKSGSDKMEVIKEMLSESYKLGEFLVHLVIEKDETIRYYSRFA